MPDLRDTALEFGIDYISLIRIGALHIKFRQ